MSDHRSTKGSSIARAHEKRNKFFEGLESRLFMSASQPSFADFSSTTGLVANGFASNPITQGTALQLTTPANNLARTVWWGQTVPVDTFTTHFSFVDTASASTGDGLTFTLQNGATSAAGGSGANLGYGSGTIGAQSVAVAFNIYNSGSFGSNFGFASGGTLPVTATDMTPVDLHNGDTYNATIVYNGTTLSVTLTDASDSAKTFHTSEAINIPQVLGTDTAIVGFTAATGNSVSTQDVTKWDYLGSNGPTITVAAKATPSTVTGKTTSLSVTATDPAGESALKYRWAATKLPAGAKTPTFSSNGKNASKTTTAHFFKAGTYRFRVTVTNALNESAISDVSVVVSQKATSIRLEPHKKVIAPSSTQRFTAAVLDQFKHPMRSQPAITWSVAAGPGSINSSTGLYTASSSVGHLVIEANDKLDKLTGTAGATVV